MSFILSVTAKDKGYVYLIAFIAGVFSHPIGIRRYNPTMLMATAVMARYHP
jgi:hypothetical protein